jgi:hypothetical protein
LLEEKISGSTPRSARSSAPVAQPSGPVSSNASRSGTR